jgi:DNA polymerase-1
MGDTADHIPGLPQIRSLASGKMIQCGAARARDVLVMSNDSDDAFQTVCKHYAVFYKDDWADRLVEQMALLWMRLDRDAKVDDFIRVLPLPSIYTDPVLAAAARLVARVQETIDATPD